MGALDRRAFLAGAGAAALAGASCGRAGPSGTGQVMTVRGPISPGEMGIALTHEHVIADVRPIEQQLAAPIAPDHDEVVDVVLPHLLRIKELGCRTLIDATGVGIGRHADVVRRLSEESGLHMLCSTGAYAAAGELFLPPYARTESADALAARWIDEARNGIEGSSVRPGFVKLSVNDGLLTETERKLLAAAATTHLETGLTIGVHTDRASAAFAQIDLLAEHGVDASAWIWIHAQNEADPEQRLRIARRGAWVSLDGLSADSVDNYVRHISAMRDAGLLGRTLVSHDAGWYTVGEPRGGDFRPFDTALAHLVPALRRAGFSDNDIATLFVANPAEAFAMRVRRRARQTERVDSSRYGFVPKSFFAFAF